MTLPNRLLFGFSALLLCSLAVAQQRLPTATAELNGHRLGLELAVTPATRSRGLMHRQHMAADRGMLFLFPAKRVVTFWMKNTSIPLDILFLDDEGEVQHIEHDVQPCRAMPCPHYGSRAATRMVLELNAGRARKLAIERGAVLTLISPENIPAIE